jgi:hypothetical protein
MSNVIGEQFWGRAVRASRDSQESGALFNFVATMLPLSHGLIPILQTASLNQKKSGSVPRLRRAGERSGVNVINRSDLSQ